MTTSTEVLTVAEAAAVLRVSLPTMYKLLHAGKLRVIHLTPRTLRISRAVLEAYIAGL